MQLRTDPDIRADIVEGNLLRFVRRLRRASIKVGTGQAMELLDAISVVGLGSRADVHAASRAVLIQRPDQIPLFDAEFDRFWRDLVRQRGVTRQDDPTDGREDDARPEAQHGDDTKEQGDGESEEDALSMSADGESALDAEESDDPDEDAAPNQRALAFSDTETLRKKNFSQYTPEEIRRAREFMQRLHWNLGVRKTRRRERALRGEFVDQRRMLRDSLKQGGIPLDLRYRRRKEKMRPLVLICDISGSMDRYSRMLLQFVHTLESGLDNVEVFVFGTRLTRITRELRKRNVDQAITDVVNAVSDWSGGTRIGEAIRAFNVRWSRRVLRSNATVILISDGWDRGDPVLLGQEMARLQRSCRRLIWLNPLLGATGYQPLTQGIRAALPYVDYFMPVHNLESLEALADLLSAVDDQPPLRRQQGAAVFRQKQGQKR